MQQAVKSMCNNKKYFLGMQLRQGGFFGGGGGVIKVIVANNVGVKI